MRTTLTLDPDVARRVKARMAEKKLSMKRVVNDALRAGLNSPKREPEVEFKVEPHSCQFKPGIDQTKLNQLLDQMDVEEFRRKFLK